MAYLTLEKVFLMYPSLEELYDRERVPAERIEEWVKEAGNIVDAKVGTRYQLPFASTPPLIETIVLELFEFFWQKSHYTPTASGDEVPWLYARYDRLMKLLTQIEKGKILLFDDDGVEIPTSSRKLGLLGSNHLDGKPIFTMDNAEDQDIPRGYGEVD